MKACLILLGVLAFCAGCLSFRGGSAAIPGLPAATRSASIGPFTLHCGTDGTNEVVRLMRGGESVYAKSGNKITVFAQGQPIFDYASNSTGTLVAAYMFHIRDAQGNVAFTLMDENADGVLDKKIDYGTRDVYQWKTNQWVK